MDVPRRAQGPQGRDARVGGPGRRTTSTARCATRGPPTRGFAARDPSGDLRRQLEANGALADGILDFAEAQQLLFSVLKAQGNPVSLDVMPDSTHTYLSGAGWKVFLAAFPKAAAKD